VVYAVAALVLGNIMGRQVFIIFHSYHRLRSLGSLGTVKYTSRFLLLFLSYFLKFLLILL